MDITEYDVKTLSRTKNGKKEDITLTPAEIDAIYRSVETGYVKEDIISRCADRKEKDMLPEVLVPLILEDEAELLEYAYNYYHKIHDCNTDYNSTLDAVIDQTAKWFTDNHLNPTKKKLYGIMSDTDLCGRFAEYFFDQINTDDEPLFKIGYYLCKAYAERDIEQLLISICGWSMDSLLGALYGEDL